MLKEKEFVFRQNLMKRYIGMFAKASQLKDIQISSTRVYADFDNNVFKKIKIVIYKSQHNAFHFKMRIYSNKMYVDNTYDHGQNTMATIKGNKLSEIIHILNSFSY